MDLQELEKPSWQKHAQLKPKAHSFQSPHLMSWANMSDRVKSWLNNCLLLPDPRNHRLFSLTKLTQCVEVVRITRMRLREEWKHSFWSKCKELVTMKQVYWFSAPLTCLGLWTQPSEDDSSEESTSLSPNSHQECTCWRTTWKTANTP